MTSFNRFPASGQLDGPVRWTMKFLLLIGVALLAQGIFIGCSRQPRGTLDEALSLYYQNKLDDALPIFQRLAGERPDDVTVHAWLAETYRRRGQKAEAVETAEKVLVLDPCNNFALDVIAESVNPVVGEWEKADSERAWHLLNESVRCDSTDGNAWLLLWGEALHRGDVPVMRRAEQKLIETRFLADAVLAYARWTLHGLPRDAILITNGDMDTYPAYAVQKVENFRPDVAIVNRGLLTTEWYARYLRDHEAVPLPFDDVYLSRFRATRDENGKPVTLSDQIFGRWVEQAGRGEFRRPIAIGATVQESYYSDLKDHLTNAGAYLLWSPKTSAGKVDVAAMQKSLEGVRPQDFAGPWTSDQDRSPIRRIYTKEIVRNVTASALSVGESLAENHKVDQALAMADWAARLDTTAGSSPAFAERIAALRKAAGQ